jgi:tetratricopeptide (TPR) repeat protein
MAPASPSESLPELFERGRRSFHLPDGMAAVAAFNRVLDEDPAYRHADGDTPYFYLGKIHEMEGRLDDAIVAYSRALAITPGDEESLIGRASCYSVTGQHAQAIGDFSKVLDIPEEHRRSPRKHLLYVIAENYRLTEDWGNAAHWARLAVDADPGNHRHQQLLKRIRARRNR